MVEHVPLFQSSEGSQAHVSSLNIIQSLGEGRQQRFILAVYYLKGAKRGNQAERGTRGCSLWGGTSGWQGAMGGFTPLWGTEMGAGENDWGRDVICPPTTPANPTGKIIESIFCP